MQWWSSLHDLREVDASSKGRVCEWKADAGRIYRMDQDTDPDVSIVVPWA